MTSASEDCRRSRTIMWCVPRTVSTAITKCLSAVDGNQIWFEPYAYAGIFAKSWKQSGERTTLPSDYKDNEEGCERVLRYLSETTSVHFKAEYVTFASLQQFLEAESGPHVFVKDMSYTTDVPYKDHFPKGYKHTFVIRHPIRAFYSYRKSMFKFLHNQGELKGSAANENTFDLEKDNPFFYSFQESQYDMWSYVRQNIDSHPIVMDTDEFLSNPAEMLPKYCRAIGLPYKESLLKWDAATDALKSWKLPADDLFEHAGYFYDTATKSSEFFGSSEMPSRDHVTPDVSRYTDRVLKYYEEMYESRVIRLDKHT